jgi:hypothetical protein
MNGLLTKLLNENPVKLARSVSIITTLFDGMTKLQAIAVSELLSLTK